MQVRIMDPNDPGRGWADEKSGKRDIVGDAVKSIIRSLERLKFAGVCGVLCWKFLNLVCVCVCVCMFIYLELKMQKHLILFHSYPILLS